MRVQNIGTNYQQNKSFTGAIKIKEADLTCRKDDVLYGFLVTFGGFVKKVVSENGNKSILLNNKTVEKVAQNYLLSRGIAFPNYDSTIQMTKKQFEEFSKTLFKEPDIHIHKMRDGFMV